MGKTLGNGFYGAVDEPNEKMIALNYETLKPIGSSTQFTWSLWTFKGGNGHDQIMLKHGYVDTEKEGWDKIKEELELIKQSSVSDASPSSPTEKGSSGSEASE